MVSGLMKVKTDDTDASISCSVAIYQNLLVACYRGMALLVSSYMYCLASYHAVELCRPCIYFDQIPLALGIRVLINIFVVILTPRLYFAEALANGWLNWRTMCLTSNHMNPSAILGNNCTESCIRRKCNCTRVDMQPHLYIIEFLDY